MCIDTQSSAHTEASRRGSRALQSDVLLHLSLPPDFSQPCYFKASSPPSLAPRLGKAIPQQRSEQCRPGCLFSCNKKPIGLMRNQERSDIYCLGFMMLWTEQDLEPCSAFRGQEITSNELYLYLFQFPTSVLAINRLCCYWVLCKYVYESRNTTW